MVAAADSVSSTERERRRQMGRGELRNRLRAEPGQLRAHDAGLRRDLPKMPHDLGVGRSLSPATDGKHHDARVHALDQPGDVSRNVRAPGSSPVMRKHQDRRSHVTIRAFQILQTDQVKIARQQRDGTGGGGEPNHGADRIAGDLPAGSVPAAGPLCGKIRARGGDRRGHRPERFAVSRGDAGVKDDPAHAAPRIELVKQVIPRRRLLRAVGIENDPLDRDDFRGQQANQAADVILIRMRKKTVLT